MAVSRSGAAGVAGGGDTTDDADRARLHQLGYKQELKRGLSLMSNFAFSFSIISVMAGVTTTYNSGLRYGGPASMTLGWLVVAAFNGCVALSMAEICSAYPTSGGLYYWSAKLAGREWAPLASWVTGWFNIVGQWAATTSTDFSLAQLVQVIVLLGTGGANGGGYTASKYVVLAIHGFFLVLHGLINSLPIRWLSWCGKLGAFWNTAGAFTLVILIPAVAKERASAKFIFTHFNDDNGMGIHGKAYILALGLLTSQYSLLGYDASAHMIEETKNADWSGPMGIISSVALSTTFGWIFLVALTSIVTDIPYLLSPDNDAGGYAVAQALYDAFDRRYGRGAGGLVCVGRRRRHLLRRAHVHRQQLEDGVRLLEGQGDAALAGVAPCEQERGAPQRRLALRRRRLRHGPHVAGESGGVPGDGVDRDAGAVHRLRAAHLLPGDDGEEVVRAGAVPPREIRGRRRLGRRPLGGLPHRALLAAGGVPGGQGQLQLHAGGRRRRVAAQRRRVGGQREVLVRGAHH
uniref:Amino-acid permease BAT1-like protein n=1 Tax=Triticum urartu TaxID=4572 RepID=A0A8R7TUJ6_TRIUA